MELPVFQADSREETPGAVNALFGSMLFVNNTRVGLLSFVTGILGAVPTVLLQIYDYAFGNSLGGDYGMATALSLMLAAFLAVFSLVYLRATRSWSTE